MIGVRVVTCLSSDLFKQTRKSWAFSRPPDEQTRPSKKKTHFSHTRIACTSYLYGLFAVVEQIIPRNRPARQPTSPNWYAAHCVEIMDL